MDKKVMILLAALALVGTGCKKSAQEADTAVKVQVTRAGSAAALQGHSYSGTIEEESGTALSFTVPGTIQRIAVDEGQWVSAGQLIAQVDGVAQSNALSASDATVDQAQTGVGTATAQVRTAQAALRQAQASEAQARDAYQRMKLIHDHGSLPEIKWVEAQTKYQQAQDAVAQAQQQLAAARGGVELASAGVRSARANQNVVRKNYNDTRLTAPYAGYISQKTAQEGQNITPGAQVVRLVNIDRVKVKISVPEADVAHLPVGSTVTFSVSSLGGRTFTGRVTERGVSANPLSRTYEVHALAANPGHALLPGMVCDVFTSVGAGQAGTIALPANVVQIDADNVTFVWTARGGKAHKTPVTLGDNVGDNVVIAAGLAPGDLVITSGQQKVSEGMKVTY